MANLKDLFNKIKVAFTVKKVVDFDDFNLHFELEPLSAMEELKVLEVCNGREGGAFVSELKRSTLAFSIKRINEVEFRQDIVDYPGENGKILKETKYLFLVKHIDELPAAFRDILFEAYNDIQTEIEFLINKNVKFERFKVQNVTSDVPVGEAGIPKGFRKIEEPKEPEPTDETERLNQQVKREAELVESEMSVSLSDAERELAERKS